MPSETSGQWRTISDVSVVNPAKTDGTWNGFGKGGTSYILIKPSPLPEALGTSIDYPRVLALFIPLKKLICQVTFFADTPSDRFP